MNENEIKILLYIHACWYPSSAWHFSNKLGAVHLT